MTSASPIVCPRTLSINKSYSEATGYTPIELEEDKKPNRFWTKYIHKPNNQNVPVPISVKIGYARQRITERGNKRVERFNLIHKLQQFNVGESVILKANPVGKRSKNTAKKFFILYNGPYTLRQRVGQHLSLIHI